MIEEKLLGFDVRELWVNPEELWDKARRDIFLLRADAVKPLSTDTMVWPAAFDTGHGIGLLAAEREQLHLAGKMAGNSAHCSSVVRWIAPGCWDRLFESKVFSTRWFSLCGFANPHQSYALWPVNSGYFHRDCMQANSSHSAIRVSAITPGYPDAIDRQHKAWQG